MRDYVPPVIPSEWTGSRKRFAQMLKETLDELHQPIREEWLSKELRDAVIYGGAESVRDYSTSPRATGVKWIDGRPIFKCTFVAGVASGSPYSITISNIDMVIDQEGCVVTSSGQCYGAGEHVHVSRTARNANYKISSTVSGTAYMTIYYVLSDE